MSNNEDQMLECVNLLKLDLAVKENNLHIGSGFGGNPSQLLYLMTHKIQSVHHNEECKFVLVDNDTIKLYLNLDSDNKSHDMRMALSKFLETQDVVAVTRKQFIDVDYLRSLKVSEDISLLIQAVELAFKFKSILDSKVSLVNDIEKSYPKYDRESNKLKSKMILDLFNEEDMSSLYEIINLPYYIGFIAFINVIGIEYICEFHIDEKPKFGDYLSLSLTKFN